MHIINKFYNSSTYIFDLGDNEFIIIDPGWPNTNHVYNLIKTKGKIASVILTHEHADHCAGLNELFELSQFNFYCTQTCAENIANSKQNFSYYMDIIEAFEIHLPSIKIKDGEVRTIGDIDFTFVVTPGHSPGSMCIFSNNSVFTGDTLLNNLKTPLTFPHSNRKHYAESIEKLKPLIIPGMTIYPGHGEPFIFESWNQFDWYKKR